MITITSAELNAIIATFVFPLVRILALLAAAPPFNNASLPTRTRLICGLAVAAAIAPGIDPLRIDPASGEGLLVLAEQMLIGYAMGLSLRLVFSAIDLAGNALSMQMGLGFATTYDPTSSSQTPVISEFIGILGLLTFLAIDGHLMVLSTLMESFRVLPVGMMPHKASWANIANAGTIVFSAGLLLALPIVVTLLITNTAIAVLGRVAPQLNIIAIGFPITISIGFIALFVCLPYFVPPLLALYEQGLLAMLGNFVMR